MRASRKYLYLLLILLLVHGCLLGEHYYHIHIKPASPESSSSSVNVWAVTSAKPKVLEIVHEVAEKYGVPQTTPSSLERWFNGSLLAKYQRRHDDMPNIEMRVYQKSFNSFQISFVESYTVPRSKIVKQMLADLVSKLSESLGKEFIITQHPR